MTDRTPIDDDGEWLRRELQPIVGDPAPDAWGAIEARVRAQDAGAIPIDTPRRDRRRARTATAIVAVAAAVVLMVIGAALVLRDGSGREVQTGSPATTAPRPSTTVQATGGTSYSELDAFDITLQVSSPTVGAERPVGATITFRNPTDRNLPLSECTIAQVTGGLVPADQPSQALPRPAAAACTPKAAVTVPAGGNFGLGFSSIRDHGGFLARRSDRARRLLGTLPAGRYLAVVEVPGRSGPRRISAAVTVPAPACRTTDADVEAYLDMKEDQARARAAELGQAFQVGSVGWRSTTASRTEPVDCDRINVDLVGDRVVGAVRH